MTAIYGNGAGKRDDDATSRKTQGGGSMAGGSGSKTNGLSPAEEIMGMCFSGFQMLFRYCTGTGRRQATGVAVRVWRRVRRNLTPARLVNFPHLLVMIWVLVLLWGERWAFGSRVGDCDWGHWEQWPSGATPHHLIFVADPQLIDPHSYPGRPWPLNPLAVMITDNYLRRSYNQLQLKLQPDTTMFLGDLFDGGREWKTAHGDFDDPSWARPHPANEAKFVSQWNKQYGEDYWIQEYMRFNDIFFKPFNLAGPLATEGQRGRKIIASLPGNHDLGFGAQVKVPVRDRFRAYFGEENRIDIIGNHTIVSVDTVSLSAGTSDAARDHNLRAIYEPADKFLEAVKTEKRKAMEKELRFWRGEPEELPLEQGVQDAEKTDRSEGGEGKGEEEGREGPELPAILLTHVPLYREPGTPCGPLREHWPPSPPPPGQDTPLLPDHRNAIHVAGGYQYQNVLSEPDSVKLVKNIGNVKHAFSGDDHDYCELVHNDKKENVREITVKSTSMAMGVGTPGFVMVSLWNPVDVGTGETLPGYHDVEGFGEKDGPRIQTMQTHLCLLPKQFDTFTRYAALVLVTLVALGLRAFLVPVMGWTPFALDPAAIAADEDRLPLYYKDKVESPTQHGHHHHHGHGGHGPYASTGSSNTNRFSSTLENRTKTPSAAATASAGGYGMDRGSSYGVGGGFVSVGSTGGGGGGKGKKDKWGWVASPSSPRIEITRDEYEDDFLHTSGGMSTWKASSGGRAFGRAGGAGSWLGLGGKGRYGGGGRRRGGTRGGGFTVRGLLREFLACVWRVVWMAGGLWVWLNWRG